MKCASVVGAVCLFAFFTPAVASALPDFRVSKIDNPGYPNDQSGYDSGKQLTIRVSVKNDGTAATGKVCTRLLVSGLQVGQEVCVTSWGAGQTLSQSFVWTT